MTSDTVYKVTADFSVDASTFTPVTNFTGTLDGDGHTITWTGTSASSAKSLTESYFGLVKTNSGTIKNLTTAGSLYVSGSSSDYVGAAAGYNAGTIDKVQNSTVVSAAGFYNADGSVVMDAAVGSTVTIAANGKIFSDVADGSWYRKAVGFAVSHELFNGVSDEEFAPGKSMTRGMFVTVLARLAGEEDFSGEAEFTDVSSDAWYASGVAWAASKGIVNGYGDGKFGPNDEVTREQMAAIMYNFTKAMGYDITGNVSLDKFSDSASVDSWAADAVKWAAGCGIVNGNTDGTLNPRGTATRAQVATIMMNYVEVLLGVK